MKELLSKLDIKVIETLKVFDKLIASDIALLLESSTVDVRLSCQKMYSMGLVCITHLDRLEQIQYSISEKGKTILI